MLTDAHSLSAGGREVVRIANTSFVLKRISGRAPDIISNGHINVRYEGIDALETHFQRTHQDLGFANAARERNLALLGFTNVRFFPDLPNVIQSVDRNPLPGYVIANGIEANGRFVGPGVRGCHKPGRRKQGICG